MTFADVGLRSKVGDGKKMWEKGEEEKEDTWLAVWLWEWVGPWESLSHSRQRIFFLRDFLSKKLKALYLTKKKKKHRIIRKS